MWPLKQRKEEEEEEEEEKEEEEEEGGVTDICSFPTTGFSQLTGAESIPK